MASLGTFFSIASVVLGRTLSDAILLSARPVINVANFFIFSSLALMAISLVYFQLLRFVSSKILNISALLTFALGVFVFSSLELSSHPAILSCAIFLVTAPALGNIIVWNNGTERKLEYDSHGNLIRETIKSANADYDDIVHEFEYSSVFLEKEVVEENAKFYNPVSQAFKDNLK